jgi:peptidoglycan/xylan/chitin deacetylase (PgdA/CDA1 family)
MTISAMAAAVVGLAGVASYATFVPRSALWCPVISRARADQPRVALTFDDGPWPESTPAILDILAEAGVSAAFFVIGRNAAAHPGLLARICSEGHILGNHSYDHDHIGIFGRRRYWLDQIDRTDTLIASAARAMPAFFRPPMGLKTPHMAAGLRARGHHVIAWSRRAFDGVATTPVRIASRLSRCRAGDVVALHDGVDPDAWRDPQTTVRALPAVIRSLRTRGLEPVRLDRLLGLPAYR